MQFEQEFKDINYLDNAATTFPKPREVLDAMTEAYARFGVNPGRSGYDLCVAAGELVQKTRVALMEFFNGAGDPDRLGFAYNASDALNLVVMGMLERGDHVITTTIEHNSVIRPVNHLVRDHGVKADFVTVGADGRVDPREIAGRFRPDTRLVIVNHGSNVIGAVQPVAEIGALCRERGIPFAIDAAQTAGMIPIDMQAMNIDVVAFTGHKSLLGPTGIGGLYIRDGVNIKGTRFGGTGVKSAHPYHLEEFPYRLEIGTCNFIGIAGLYYAQQYIADRGLENIFRHEMELFRKLFKGIKEIEGVTVYGSDSMENRLPVLSFNIRGMDAADVGTILDVDFNVATRTGLHCAPLIHKQLGTGERGSVRMSLGPMNEMKNIEAGIEAVRELTADALA